MGGVGSSVTFNNGLASQFVLTGSMVFCQLVSNAFVLLSSRVLPLNQLKRLGPTTCGGANNAAAGVKAFCSCSLVSVVNYLFHFLGERCYSWPYSLVYSAYNSGSIGTAFLPHLLASVHICVILGFLAGKQMIQITTPITTQYSLNLMYYWELF